MDSAIPFSTEPNPTTGFTNAKLGTWLFIASEVMLFGALFSAYIVLRSGALEWPVRASGLTVGWGIANTVLLMVATVMTALMEGAASKDRMPACRRYLLLALLFGVAFLLGEGAEWWTLLRSGLSPSVHNFYALYFVLTGVHALHVLGGVGLYGYLLGRSSCCNSTRIECAALYWYFVDLIWVALFITFYFL